MTQQPEVIQITPELAKAIQSRLFHRQRTPSAEAYLIDRGFDPETFYRAIDDVRRQEVAALAREVSRKQQGRMSEATCQGFISMYQVEE